MWRKKSGAEFEVPVGSSPPPGLDAMDPAKRLRMEGKVTDSSVSVPSSPFLGPHYPTNAPISTPTSPALPVPLNAPVPVQCTLVLLSDVSSLCPPTHLVLCSTSDQPCDDIGLLLKSTSLSSVRSFSWACKNSILFGHFGPTSDSHF